MADKGLDMMDRWDDAALTAAFTKAMDSYPRGWDSTQTAHCGAFVCSCRLTIRFANGLVFFSATNVESRILKNNNLAIDFCISRLKKKTTGRVSSARALSRERRSARGARVSRSLSLYILKCFFRK